MLWTHLNKSIQYTAPLVSVIIPFFNRIELVEECLNSVVQQSYRPLQIVLVDDCSTQSLPSLTEFKNLSVDFVYIRNEINLGPGKSREKGIQYAKGQFIHFLDSDDLIKGNFYLQLTEKIIEDESLSFVYCYTRIFNQDKIIGDRKNQFVVNNIVSTIYTHGRIWCTASCLWRKEILLKYGKWESTNIWEDYFLDLHVGLRNSHISCVPEYLCYVRRGENESLSQNISSERVLKKMLIISKMINKKYWINTNVSESNRVQLISWLYTKYSANFKHYLNLSILEGKSTLGISINYLRNSKFGINKIVFIYVYYLFLFFIKNQIKFMIKKFGYSFV